MGDVRDDDDDHERKDDGKCTEWKQLTLGFAVKWILDESRDVESFLSPTNTEDYTDDEAYKRTIRVAELLG